MLVVSRKLGYAEGCPSNPWNPFTEKMRSLENEDAWVLPRGMEVGTAVGFGVGLHGVCPAC
jgi:hypothetical protein